MFVACPKLLSDLKIAWVTSVFSWHTLHTSCSVMLSQCWWPSSYSCHFGWSITHRLQHHVSWHQNFTEFLPSKNPPWPGKSPNWPGFYHLVMTFTVCHGKIHPFLSSVNHLFRLGPSIPWRTVGNHQVGYRTVFFHGNNGTFTWVFSPNSSGPARFGSEAIHAASLYPSCCKSIRPEARGPEGTRGYRCDSGSSLGDD